MNRAASMREETVVAKEAPGMDVIQEPVTLQWLVSCVGIVSLHLGHAWASVASCSARAVVSQW